MPGINVVRAGYQSMLKSRVMKELSKKKDVGRGATEKTASWNDEGHPPSRRGEVEKLKKRGSVAKETEPH